MHYADLRILPTVAVLVGGAVTAAALASRVSHRPAGAPERAARAGAAYGHLPQLFEPNRGQAPAEVKFLSRGPGHQLRIGAEGLRLQPSTGAASSPISLRWLRANPHPQFSGERRQDAYVNYLIGNDPSRWQTHIPTYEGVRCRDLYPGVDLVYYGGRERMEYDFVVAPGADPARIRFAVKSEKPVRVDGAGDLVLSGAGHEVRQTRPLVYQERAGTRTLVAAKYMVDGSEIGFELGEYDRTRPLVIDPVLVYSTLLGGSNLDQANAIAVDTDGNAYVTGETASLNDPQVPSDRAFPTTNRAFRKVHNGGTDVFVAKLDPTGSRLLYSTFLGGSAADAGFGIAVDLAGNAYVTGATNSAASVADPNLKPFPTRPSGFQREFGGGASDAFLAKLDANGSTLLYGTYLGGTGPDGAGGIVIDGDGTAYLTGTTGSRANPADPGSVAFPLRRAFQTEFNGGLSDAFVAHLDPDSSGQQGLLYSTYLGGIGDETGNGIALETTGRVWVTGGTTSDPAVGVPDQAFPTTAGAYSRTFSGVQDAFVAQLNVTAQGANSFLYGTLLGGADADEGMAIAANGQGSVYLAGRTASREDPLQAGNQAFPTTASAFQRVFGGGASDAFVARLDWLTSGSAALFYSTYLGGNRTDEALALVLEPTSVVFVAGRSGVTADTPTTGPGPFPTTANALRRAAVGGADAILARVDPSLSGAASLWFGSYLGGSADDLATAVAQGTDGSLYVAGGTLITGNGSNATPFPTTVRSYQRQSRGLEDAFVTRISDGALGGRLKLTPNNLSFGTAKLGQVKSKTLKLRNVGTGLLTGTVGEVDAPFVVLTGQGDFSLQPGNTHEVMLQFLPTVTGKVSANLLLTTSDPTRTELNLRLSGKGKPGNAGR